MPRHRIEPPQLILEPDALPARRPTPGLSKAVTLVLALAFLGVILA